MSAAQTSGAKYSSPPPSSASRVAPRIGGPASLGCAALERGRRDRSCLGRTSNTGESADSSAHAPQSRSTSDKTTASSLISAWVTFGGASAASRLHCRLVRPWPLSAPRLRCETAQTVFAAKVDTGSTGAALFYISATRRRPTSQSTTTGPPAAAAARGGGGSSSFSAQRELTQSVCTEQCAIISVRSMVLQVQH